MKKKTKQQLYFERAFDHVMDIQIELLGVRGVPKKIRQALDYVANYCGDISTGRKKLKGLS